MHLVETAKQKHWWHCTLLIVPVFQLYSELLGSLLKYKIILLSMTLWQRCVCLCENLSFWFEVVRSEARMCKLTGAKSNGTVLSSQWVDHPSGGHHFTKMLTSAELVELTSVIITKNIPFQHIMYLHMTTKPHNFQRLFRESSMCKWDQVGNGLYSLS